MREVPHPTNISLVITSIEFVEVQFQARHDKKRLNIDFAKLEKISQVS